jgi:hypothetical protein
MPAKRESEKQRRAAFYAGQEKQAAARRGLNSGLMFWKACGHKRCMRAHACVTGDGSDCSRRLWPVLPEQFKIGFRALVKARQARLSDAETKAAIVREIRRWREMIARQNASQTAAPATAEPAPQLPPVVRAAPRAPTPRVRML